MIEHGKFDTDAHLVPLHDAHDSIHPPLFFNLRTGSFLFKIVLFSTSFMGLYSSCSLETQFLFFVFFISALYFLFSFFIFFVLFCSYSGNSRLI
jgi:hypothetical protein